MVLYKILLVIQYRSTVSTLQRCSSNQCHTARMESKLSCRFKSCSSHPMRLNTHFKQGSTPCIPKTTLSYEATTPQYEECSRFFPGTLLSSQPSLFSAPLTIVKKIILVSPTFFVTTAHICMTMMSFDVSTMTNFYRRSSNCQPHHSTVQYQ